MKSLSKHVTLAILALAPPSAAHAQTVDASDPSSLLGEIGAAGYTVELTKDADGKPLINGSFSGSNFKVYFLDCSGKTNCSNVQFFAGYRKRDKVTLAWINDYNAKARFVRAYLSPAGEPRLALDVSIRNGMSREKFRDYVTAWAVEWNLFEAAIEGK